jgi:hypothetical protein
VNQIDGETTGVWQVYAPSPIAILRLKRRAMDAQNKSGQDGK